MLMLRAPELAQASNLAFIMEYYLLVALALKRLDTAVLAKRQ